MRRLNEVLRSAKLDAKTSKPEAEDSPSREEGAPEAPPADDEVCPHCHDVGFVRQDLPLDHPEFGKALLCRCVEEENHEVRLSRLQRYSNLGPLTRLTFDNLIRRGRSADPRDQARFQRCVDDAEAFAKDPEGWLVLVGASGCGKTHIGAAIANRCLEHGVPALFVVVPDLLDHLRAAYKPAAEVDYDQLFDQVRTTPVLILDDLGTQSATPWAEEKLFQIINYRFNARLPTVVTTNVPLRSTDDRLRTRLTDMALAKVYELEEKKVLEYENINLIFTPRIRAMTFENFDSSGHGLPSRERQSLEAAYRGCLTFAQEPDGWIVLTGSPGCGKSHLAAAIANLRLHQGSTPMFLKVSRMLQLYRSTFEEGTDRKFGEIEQEIENASLLILDDLFFRSSSTWKSEWANERLFSMLDYRYENRLHTVVTTALTENAMMTDDAGRRFAARLFDYGISSELPITAGAYKHSRTPRKRGQKANRSEV